MKGRPMAAVVMATAIATSSATLGLSESPPRMLADPAVVGDAMPGSLTGRPGNAVRGRRIVLDRETGNCLICHKVPEPAELFQGDLGPDLGGVGKRLTAGQIRLRLADQSRLNPRTLMPPYHRAEGLNRVAAKYEGRPVLTAQEMEDVIAYLGTLTR
jgi:L-cysteine S-thiosulfotransferase